MADDSSSSSSSGTGSRPFPVLIPVPRFSDVTSNFSEGDYGRWLALAGASGAMGAYVGTAPRLRGPHGARPPPPFAHAAALAAFPAERAQLRRPCGRR